jgi:selT/selW/selH-like putative selenoprotein
LADEIKKNINDVNIELIKGSGGDFEVVKDGQLIFSKRKEGRFPESSEILNKLT